MTPQNHSLVGKDPFSPSIPEHFQCYCTYKIRIWLCCDSIDSCKLRKDMGNTEFHACKSQEQQKTRKKTGFSRQPQMRQKSTTAAAAALLTDQVVLKVDRKVVQEMQQPWCGGCWGCCKYPGNRESFSHGTQEMNIPEVPRHQVFAAHSPHSAESPTAPTVEMDLLPTAPRATALWCL